MNRKPAALLRRAEDLADVIAKLLPHGRPDQRSGTQFERRACFGCDAPRERAVESERTHTRSDAIAQPNAPRRDAGCTTPVADKKHHGHCKDQAL
jgi:hypothetical protein